LPDWVQQDIMRRTDTLPVALDEGSGSKWEFDVNDLLAVASSPSRASSKS
jgi:hypothetical protein